MCLKLSIIPYLNRRRTAKQDIVCYKVVNKHPYPELVQSYFLDFTYEIGLLYKSTIVKDWFLVEDGFHSFTKLADANRWARDCMSGRVVVVKCVIPKGSHYYKGYWHDRVNYSNYVSNQIIIKEII